MTWVEKVKEWIMAHPKMVAFLAGLLVGLVL